MLRRSIPLLALAIGLAATANAAPPEGADPDSPKAQLYQALKDPAGLSCCSIADCRPTNAWIDGGHWMAEIPGVLAGVIAVPDDKVLQHHQSPEGLQAVICLRYFGGVPEVRCFIPGGQA